MKAFSIIGIFLLAQVGWGMSVTDGRDFTYVARNDDFQQVIVVLTGVMKDIPSEGEFDASIQVIVSLVNDEYKPANVKWILPRPNYGGGLAYKNGSMYLLAINDGRIVWELSREITISSDNELKFNIPLTGPEYQIVLSKKSR
jgi:hypothetical protein